MAVYSIRQGNDNGRQAYITGNNGVYNGKIKNPNVRYARNAINNLHQYASYRMPQIEYPDLENISKISDEQFDEKMEQLGFSLYMTDKAIKSIPPLDYTVKYLSGKTNHDNLDRVALIGAAYEDMERNSSLPTAALSGRLRMTFLSDNISADVLDLNKDGEIDTGEYASSILAADMLSKDSLDISAINGKITQKGHLNLLSFFNKKNEPLASKVFNFLHGFFNLDEAKDEFAKNPNNSVK